MRILVAEDNNTDRLVLISVLNKCGYEVVVTENGEEAWAELQKPNAPKLIILDWIMPVMDGQEVIRRIKTLKSSSPPYIILLTSKDEKADIIAGLGTGANDYLAKPFDPGELCARIQVGQRMIETHEALAGATGTPLKEMEIAKDPDIVKQLAKLAYLDQETQLPNQNYLLKKMQSMHYENQMTGIKSGLILIRIDNLKAIYDQYDPDIANKAITMIKDTLCNNMEDSCSFGRWDDTSFLFIIPNTNIEETKTAAFKLQRLVKTSTIKFLRSIISFQASLKFYMMDNNNNFEINFDRFRNSPFLK